jgi:hypothetical protein
MAGRGGIAASKSAMDGAGAGAGRGAATLEVCGCSGGGCGAEVVCGAGFVWVDGAFDAATGPVDCNGGAGTIVGPGPHAGSKLNEAATQKE